MFGIKQFKSARDVAVLALFIALANGMTVFAPSMGPITIWPPVIIMPFVFILFRNMSLGESLLAGIAQGVVGALVSKSPIGWFNIVYGPCTCVTTYLFTYGLWKFHGLRRYMALLSSLFFGWIGDLFFFAGLWGFGFLPPPFTLAGILFYLTYELVETPLSIVCQFLYPVVLRGYVRIAPEMKGRYGLFGV